MSEADASAIRALLQTYEAAINRRDVEAAVVESSGTVTMSGDSISERITWVVNRTAAGWRIAAVRIMAFQRAAPMR